MSNLAEIYIGNNKLDFNDTLNVEYSLSDFSEFGSGSNNTSYSITIPLTDNNKRVLKYTDSLSTFDSITDLGKIVFSENELITGIVKILGFNKTTVNIIIESTDWLNGLDTLLLTDLDLSSYNLTYNSANVLTTWSAALGNFIRFPYVNYGQYALVNDLIHQTYLDYTPWFNVLKILKSILKNFTLNSTFLNSTYFQNLYVRANEDIKDDSFIKGDYLKVSQANITDNAVTLTLSSTPQNVGLTKSPIVLSTVTTNIENSFTSNVWTCKTEGSYNIYHLVQWNYVNFPFLTSTNVTYKLYKNGVAIETYTDTTLAVNVTKSNNLPITYLYVNDTLYLEIVFDTLWTGGVGQNITIRLTSATLQVSASTNQNLYPSDGFIIKPNKLLPQISQLDFLQGLKQAFNLQFTYDRFNNSINCEPAMSFSGTSIKKLNIDYADISIENISNNYSKSIFLNWLKDSSDQTIDKYENNKMSRANNYNILLTDNNTIKNITNIDNTCFATFLEGKHVINNWNNIAMIFDEYDPALYNIPQYRIKACGFKLGIWAGLISTNTFYFGGVSKTQIPKISPVLMSDLYANYFAPYFKQIDGGKLIKVKCLYDPILITELNTKISDYTKEGFRRIYSFDYQNETHYGYLNKLITDGKLMDVELLLIH